MEKARKMTLYELLRKKYPGFYKTGKDALNPEYVFNSQGIMFVIDGVFINFFHLPVDLYMNYLTAEDVKGIEVMYKTEHTIPYAKAMHRYPFTVPLMIFEITTYSGDGAFMTKVPGVYIYKPLPFTLPKKFYRPKYTVKSKAIGTDQRSTIHWKPNIITDKDGKAVVSFYSADRPAGYTIIMQGTDLNGQVGFMRQKVLIH